MSSHPLSDRGTEFISQVSRDVYETFRNSEEIYKFLSSPDEWNVERLNHTLCQMLSYLIADDQKKWDDILMHAVAAHNVSRGTGLAPNEVHTGRYPRLPMTILEGRGSSRSETGPVGLS